MIIYKHGLMLRVYLRIYNVNQTAFLDSLSPPLKNEGLELLCVQDWFPAFVRQEVEIVLRRSFDVMMQDSFFNIEYQMAYEALEAKRLQREAEGTKILEALGYKVL